MVVNMNIFGIPQTIALLQKKVTNINKQISDSMNKTGRLMQNEVKESISGHRSEPTSVDTGHLMRNVFFIIKGNEVIIFTCVPYANHVENSTKIKGGPRRHFQNSLNRNKLKIVEILRQEIKYI